MHDQRSAKEYAEVCRLSRMLNHTLQQPTRNSVLRLATDIRDLCMELLLHNQQGQLDLKEMRDKVEGIQEAAYELEGVLKAEQREGSQEQ